MTDRPIIFSATMVQALLAGRKTQIRMPIPPHPIRVGHPDIRSVRYAPGDRLIPCIEIPGFRGMYAAGADGNIWSFAKGDERKLVATVPAGKGYPSVSLLRPNGKTTCKSVHRLICEAFHGPPPTPDHECRHLDGNKENGRPSNLWWGTREENWQYAPDLSAYDMTLTLTVTEVRVQRLQDISEADAVAEGAEPIHMQPGGPEGDPSQGWISYREGFCRLWNSLHGPEAWDRNDWVCVIHFETEKRNIDQIGTAS